MAKGIARILLADKFIVFSAGSSPSSVNPYAVQGMQEIGIDISHLRSNSVKEFY